jgi:NAD+ diphosphatase
LNRATGKKHKDPEWEREVLQNESTKFILFSTQKGSTGAAPFLLKERPLPPIIAWQTRKNLEALSVEPVGYSCNGVPPILLGELSGTQHFALLVDKSEEDLTANAACPEGKKPFVAEGMSQLFKIGCDQGDHNIIGHAFAKLVWHKKSLYCGSCGKENKSIECGLKRQCPECKARAYPRIEASCMALVKNNEDSKCLLISGQDKSTPHMWTCVSGFVEQCEQVEECAKREVWEETGVEVDLSKGADWFGSQPWPMGVGGQCELMLALELVAVSEDTEPNKDEILDARWFTRQEVEGMLKAMPWNKEGTPFVPPYFSEAHFLLQRWVRRASKAEGGGYIPA